jgi:hypothetical protein
MPGNPHRVRVLEQVSPLICGAFCDAVSVLNVTPLFEPKTGLPVCDQLLPLSEIGIDTGAVKVPAVNCSPALNWAIEVNCTSKVAVPVVPLVERVIVPDTFPPD